MIDVQRTLNLTRGAVLEPRVTWESYLAENKTWQETAMLLPVPLIVLSSIISGLLSWMLLPFNAGFVGWLMGLVMGFVGLAAATAIFTLFAGVFKGQTDFNRGFAAVSLAWVPSWIGGMIAPIPVLGWLAALGLLILSLVYLWRIIPTYLGVPDDQRALHYIVSLISTVVAYLILAMILGAGTFMSQPSFSVSSTGESSDTSFAAPGFFGELARQGELTEQAGQDQYDPPGDGRLDEKQVERYVMVMSKAREMQEEYIQRVEKMAEEMEDKQDASLADFGKMMSGMSGAASAANAAMEVVKTTGGNWAEHTWVEQQLRIARYQKDTTDAIAHNYELYQKYADQLDEISPI